MTLSIGEEEIITPEQVYDLSKAFDTGDTFYLTRFALKSDQLERIDEFIPNIMWLGKVNILQFPFIML